MCELQACLFVTLVGKKTLAALPVQFDIFLSQYLNTVNYSIITSEIMLYITSNFVACQSACK